MKIGFFGTPEIASYCLNRLLGEYEVVFVVTGEDKPSGRNRKIRFSPVKELAVENGIKVLQTSNLLDPEFVREIKDKAADIFVVVAFGKIIPSGIFNYPPLKTINLHPSLLPGYRGAAPIQWVLINGEKETGVTVQIVSDKLDAGDIVLQRKIPLDIDMTASELYDIILPQGAELLVEAIQSLSSGRAELKQQDENNATYYSKIDKELALINWNRTSLEIHNLVRGLNPKPASYTAFRGKNVKIWKTLLFESIESAGVIKSRPGHISVYKKKRLLAGTGDGCLEIISIQPENKRVMDGLSFINGYRPDEDDRFE